MRKKISTIFGKAERSFDELKKELIGLENNKENRESLREELDDHWKEIKRIYHSYINPAIHYKDKDDKWIMARYLYQEKHGSSIIEPSDPYRWIEVYNKVKPPEMKPCKGYPVLLDGKLEKGSNVCDVLGINYGQDSAPRYLWNYLNDLADKNGVENPDFMREKDD